MYFYFLGDKMRWQRDKNVGGDPYVCFGHISKWSHVDDETSVIDIVMPPMGGIENKIWNGLELCYEVKNE